MSTVRETKALEEYFRSLHKHIQEELEACPYSRTFRDALKLLSRTDISKTSMTQFEVEMGKEYMPEVGEVYRFSPDLKHKVMSPEDCNLDDHCIIDTWTPGDELKVIAIAELRTGVYPVVQNLRTTNVSTIKKCLLELIKSERDECVEQMIKDLGANIYVNDRSFAEVLYDAGYRLTEVAR